MAATFEVIESRGRFGKWEHAVNDGADGVTGEESKKGGEIGDRADVDPGDCRVFLEQGKKAAVRRAKAGEDTDESDVPARRGAGERLLQGARTADLDHVVDPAPVGPIENGGLPVGIRAVIDGGFGAERPGASEFLLAARGDHDAGAGNPGELKGKDGNATGALHENGLAGLKPAASKKGLPRGDRRAGKAGGFFESHAIGHADQSVLGQHNLAGEHPAGRSAEGGAVIFETERTIDPIAEEVGGNAISRREAGHARAGREDFTRAIGERDDTGEIRLTGFPAQGEQVTVVQRNRPHADENLAGARRGCRGVGEPEMERGTFGLELPLLSHGAGYRRMSGRKVVPNLSPAIASGAVINYRYRLETGGCPIEVTLDVLGGRWKSLLLYKIWEGERRFRDLRAAIPHVSQRMLARQLRELERDGLIARREKPGPAPRVEYALTPMAEKLAPTLRALRDWGAEYLAAGAGAKG